MTDYFNETTTIPDPASNEEFLEKLLSGEDPYLYGRREVPHPIYVHLPDARLRTDAEMWHIVLHRKDDPKQFVSMALRTDVVLGVHVEGHDDQLADIVLNRWDGRDHGVSRRHLLIRPTASRLHVLDLRSTNGSWMNAVKLLPNQSYPLKPRSLLTVGTLDVAVVTARKMAYLES